MLIRNIIFEQLPKMTKEYIMKIVFDPSNKTIICRSNQNNKILGCLTFKIYEEIKMTELIFLSIRSD